MKSAELCYTIFMKFCNPVISFAKVCVMSRLLFILLITLTGFFIALPKDVNAQGPAAFSDPGARQSGTGNPAGGLIPVEPNVDGGTIPIGATAQVVVRFRNEGSQSVETGLIRLYPSSNVSANISLNQCQEGPLTAGAECAIALSVKGLQSGAWRVEMLMSHNGRTRLVSATLSGTVEATGEGADKLTSDIEAIPDEIDFGALNSSQTLVEPIILRNITSIPLSISDIYIDASDSSGYELKTECEKLEPGQACIATVRWAPKLRGQSSGVLVVKHDGPTALSSVLLKGDYQPDSVDQAEVFPEAVPGKGLLVSSQTEIDFGTEVESASTITVSLVNVGDAPVELSDITIAGVDNGLSFKGTGCSPGTLLEPIEACPLTVSWSPTRIGTILDDIQVVHSGARGILVLPVRGESTNTVSQDQGAIMLSGALGPMSAQQVSVISSADDITGEDGGTISQRQNAARNDNASRVGRPASFTASIPNPSSVLDGLKITSFSPRRAIVAGPGGSRIVFDNEDIVLGGIPWSVNIQRNGIEFSHQGQTVLLLFDRSLSSVNRVQSQSDSDSTTSSTAAESSDTSEE